MGVLTKCQVNHGADDGGVADALSLVARMITKLARELVGATRVVFPEINAVAKPVIIIVARIERRLPRQDSLGDAAVAAVVSKDELVEAGSKRQISGIVWLVGRRGMLFRFLRPLGQAGAKKERDCLSARRFRPTLAGGLMPPEDFFNRQRH